MSKPFNPGNHPRCPKNGKLRYKSEQSAERILAQAIIHGSAKQIPRRAYRCKCGGWHLTAEEKRS